MGKSIPKTNVLVIGSGGREHAFIHSLAADERVGGLFCAPGNGGTVQQAYNVDIEADNLQDLLRFAQRKRIGLTVVGPEVPLALGIVDEFKNAGMRIFGPTKAAAMLESSKLFARDLLDKHGVPQPKYAACKSESDVEAASKALGLPLVMKADGLAAGKGVLICRTETELAVAIQTMFGDKIFGDAGASVSLEQCLEGEELSVFAVCSGTDFVILNSAQDHKRALDGDEGPNTGGMGAYSPTPLATPELMDQVSDMIIRPTLEAMAAEDHPYTGFLYVGLMITEGSPYVIEFNVRMGDPEGQVVFPLLDSSLFELLYLAADGKLSDIEVDISASTAVTLVLAAEGYPGKYEKGFPIRGLTDIGDALVYHAGTQDTGKEILTTGGRVLNVVGFGETLQDAIRDAYQIAGKIDFTGKWHRMDIGARGLKYLEESQ